MSEEESSGRDTPPWWRQAADGTVFVELSYDRWVNVARVRKAEGADVSWVKYVDGPADHCDLPLVELLRRLCWKPGDPV